MDLSFFVAFSLLREYLHALSAHFPACLSVRLSFLSPGAFGVAVFGAVLTTALSWCAWKKQFCTCTPVFLVPPDVLVWSAGLGFKLMAFFACLRDRFH